MESNDSPEIPDREETSDIPGLPSGGEGGGERDREFVYVCNCKVTLVLLCKGVRATVNSNITPV